ncbi:MAG: hypothetical protein J6A59_09175 [Lachnospiraceae bacterium]|nr:hypothetical protein [Lachnospiraceae bacterium]
MKYTFNDMLNAEIYETAQVMLVLGKYSWFNNMVVDTLKSMCMEQSDMVYESVGINDEFGMNTGTDEIFTNSVDFSTFMDVIGVASVNGKWFCRADYKMMTKKQRETLLKYIKEPSINGILVVVAEDWKDYKDLLKNRILSFSKNCHMLQLSFPNRQVLKSITIQTFLEKGINVAPDAVDFFIMRMSRAYDEYENTIDMIIHAHKEPVLSAKDMKGYMRNIEYFTVDDFVEQLTKPLSSEKSNSKKILKIMMSLEDSLGAKNLVYQTLKQVDEYIEYRLLINSGYIPIGIKYFFNDVINKLPEEYKAKYEKKSEWRFRKDAEIASRTSLRDWEYIKLILFKAIEDVKLPDDIIDAKCQKALYEISTRSVIASDRINNIIGIDNILHKDINSIDRITFDEDGLLDIDSWVDSEGA